MGEERGMSTTSLDGQVAIVTGGAQGIGFAISRKLAERGARVIVWDRDLGPLEGSGFAPARAETVDVASYPAVERAFAAAVAEFGQVDIAVNNAGINGPIKPSWEYPLEDWDRVVAIDMTAVFYLSRLAAKHMRERRYGRIITVASIAGKEGVQNLCAYSAAKAALNAAVKGLARPLAAEGVRINAVAPGNILFPGGAWANRLVQDEAGVAAMLARDVAQGRLGTPEEIAALAVFLASPKASFVTGTVMVADGGQLR
jgi:3-oxoacyl-[acyl-carrier protein] reductase